MATIKSYTSLEQSKKLAEILPLESANMWYHGHNGPMTSDMRFDNEPAAYHSLRPNWDIPCWSLAALLDVLSNPSLYKTYTGWRCDTYNENCTKYQLGDIADNPVDACYEMILKLSELNLL